MAQGPDQASLAVSTARLIVRRNSGAWRPADELALQRWLTGPAQRRVALQRAELAWQSLARLGDAPQIALLCEQALDRLAAPKRRAPRGH
jgi:ferric-dicitrate binding protein FerR (iron transport regulator)